MAASKSNGKGTRLGTKLRGRLEEAYGARGHHQSSLWSVYSPRTNRDWVLRGDLEWGHFLFAESDPKIETINYSPVPQIVRVGDEDCATELDAEVKFKNGRIQWREIKFSDSFEELDARSQRQWKAQAEAANSQGIEYVRFTENEIFANPQRIANWRRVVAWLAAVRGRSLYSQHVEVAALLNAQGSASLEEIRLLGSGPESAYYVAAVLKGVQDGKFFSDLDVKPFNKNSTFTSVEVNS